MVNTCCLAPTQGCVRADRRSAYMLRGYSDCTTDDVGQLTGHPATSYKQFARDFADRFRRG